MKDRRWEERIEADRGYRGESGTGKGEASLRTRGLHWEEKEMEGREKKSRVKRWGINGSQLTDRPPGTKRGTMVLYLQVVPERPGGRGRKGEGNNCKIGTIEVTTNTQGKD